MQHKSTKGEHRNPCTFSSYLVMIFTHLHREYVVHSQLNHIHNMFPMVGHWWVLGHITPLLQGE
jgi:hypothetical protein